MSKNEQIKKEQISKVLTDDQLGEIARIKKQIESIVSDSDTVGQIIDNIMNNGGNIGGIDTNFGDSDTWEIKISLGCVDTELSYNKINKKTTVGTTCDLFYIINNKDSDKFKDLLHSDLDCIGVDRVALVENACKIPVGVYNYEW